MSQRGSLGPQASGLMSTSYKTPQTTVVDPRWRVRHHHTIRVFINDSILDRWTKERPVLVNIKWLYKQGRVERRKDNRRYYRFLLHEHLIRLCRLAFSQLKKLVPMSTRRTVESYSGAPWKNPLANPFASPLRGVGGAIGLPVSTMVRVASVPVALN